MMVQKRKSPVRHAVRAHKRSGHSVDSYSRGKKKESTTVKLTIKKSVKLTLKQQRALDAVKDIVKNYEVKDWGLTSVVINAKIKNSDRGLSSTTRILNSLVDKGVLRRTIFLYEHSPRVTYYNIRKAGEEKEREFY